jgi:RNA polymerase sigma factor (TIGR02999 family)
LAEIDADIGVITSLLRKRDSRGSDDDNRLAELVYARLHKMAGRQMSAERAGHTLQTTGLVNEAFADLFRANINWHDRKHFYAVAANQMRRILVNHANHRNRQKRGGKAVHITLEGAEAQTPEPTNQILDLDRALTDLQEENPRLATMVELHYFAGLTYRELAQTLDTSEATVHRDLRLAKAWISRNLSDPDR